MSAAIGAFFTYAVASAFFWHYPYLLHKKKKVSFHAAHISHRGGSAEGLENTIRNFQSAIDKGTDLLELDVRLTKDKRVVVFHDKDLKRMAGSDIKISDIDYSCLPSLSKNAPIDTVPGKCFSDDDWTEADRKIPLLSQVLKRFPTVPMNIDIKDNDDVLIEEVSRLLTKFERQKITVWGSFDNKVCQKCYKMNPDVCLFVSAKRVLVLFLLTVTGILPFVPIKETHYEVFLPLALKKRRIEQAGKLSLPDKVMFWICETFVVSKPLIAHLKKRGIHVYLWVCNHEDEFELCKNLGATGIMSDYPTKLREFLDASDNKYDPDQPLTS